MEAFIKSFAGVQKEVHETAKEKGWYNFNNGLLNRLSNCWRILKGDKPILNRENPELISLIHSELSECLEALRKGDKQDEHCPIFKNAVIELADCIIRCMDMAEYNNWPLAQAIIAKMEYNKTRPYKHGKKF